MARWYFFYDNKRLFFKFHVLYICCHTFWKSEIFSKTHKNNSSYINGIYNLNNFRFIILTISVIVMHTKATLKIVFPLFLTARNFTAILPHESWVFLNQPTLVSYLVRCIILLMLLFFICGRFLFLNFQQVSHVQVKIFHSP